MFVVYVSQQYCFYKNDNYFFYILLLFSCLHLFFSPFINKNIMSPSSDITKGRLAAIQQHLTPEQKYAKAVE